MTILTMFCVLLGYILISGIYLKIKGPCITTNAEDAFMEVAYEVFKVVKSTDFYFCLAPKELLEMRNKIHERVSAVLDIYNNNKKYPVI